MSRKKNRHKKRNFGKGIYILPNLFTTASLFAGFYSIINSIQGDYTSAALAILISGILDGLDGTVARITGSTSKFGMEYDSLCDLVAFGVAPALLVFLWGLEPFGRLGWVAAFLFMTCGALRLARFNVMSSVKSSVYFQGLAIPAGAGAIAATVFWFGRLGDQGPVKNVGILILVFALAFLMVSNFRYLSLKDPELLKAKPFNTMVAAVLIFSLFAIRPRLILFVLTLGYAASGPVLTLIQARRLKRRRQLGLEPEAESEAKQSEDQEKKLDSPNTPV